MVAMIANPSPSLMMVAELARRWGVSIDKVNRWRQAGMLPEFVKAGRINLFPGDKVAEVRNRLIASGHIDPERDQPFVRASESSLATTAH